MILTCPQDYIEELLDQDINPFHPVIFMGGGITGCGDWQSWFGLHVHELPAVFLNPRRANFDITDESMSVEQIAWEHLNISESDAIMFWFPAESVCPITLYELGVQVGKKKKKIFVGCSDGYPRKFDIIEQLKNEKCDIEVVNSLEKLAAQIEEWVNTLV